MKLIKLMGLTALLFSSSSYATEQTMSIERVNYKILGYPVGPYSHAVKHNNTLYLSGLTAYGTQEQKLPIEDQAKSIFKQIEALAKEENIDLSRLIKVTLYVTELERISQLRTALFDIYQTQLPASALVKVESLFSPELKIEVEAILAL